MLKIARLTQNPLKGVNKRFGPIFDKDLPKLDDFLTKYAPGNRVKVRNKLIHYNEYCKGKFNVENIFKIEYDHAKDFLEKDLDARPTKIVTKRKWLSQIRGYYKFVKDLRNSMNDATFEKNFGIKKEDYIIPIPKRFAFTEPKPSLKKIKKKYKEGKLTYNHALKLLNYYYFENFEMFICVGISVWSGPRIEEIVSIEVENIEMDEIIVTNDAGEKEKVQLRFFLTELKRTHQKNKFGIYCFPKFFTEHLKLHIAQKELKYPKDKFLFPSTRYKNQHLAQTTIRRRIHETCDHLNINVKITPHPFRALLNTHRTRMGSDPDDRIKLLNQTIDRTEAEHYNLDYEQFIELQKKYDATFPYPEFKPNPNYMKDY